ncbi:PAS domain S-box protein [Pseudomonas sp. S75]|uniref:two-component system sensor histidine kinase NtrB n=1 Tax=unclassified Pseudomonas TaxID=196821 RepID=UPI0019039EE4|nr:MULTISPECIES: PAS domain-containing sensor histidine kinase [unclassified Pseudomonas]MBJ9976554.1 PAS domain S-box protein [Pseudomonas sp. S30]MBK0154370.1 PAS domain S-box protein [Pseudomonas sp. S75]
MLSTDLSAVAPTMPADHYERLVHAVVDYAIYMLDPQGRVVSWNSGAQRIKGYGSDEVIGRHFSLFFTEQDCAQGRPAMLLNQALQQGVAQDEGWRVRKDGSRFWALTVLDIVRDDGGQVIGLAKVTRDITDRRESGLQLDAMRAQLFQAQKLEALGQLTGGLAHDFNNLLTIILGSARLARASTDHARIDTLLGHIVDAGQRGAQLTHVLLSFARHRQLNVAPIAPAELIASTCSLISHALPDRIELRTEIEDDLPQLEVDVGQLQMVLLNLLFNARDAIVEGGHIALRVRRAVLPAQSNALQGEFLRFDVEDDGSGIPVEVLPRIFEPFFTTKAFGKGTGLGLSQVYGFAQQSNGAVDVASIPGEGTVMSLYLPLTATLPSQAS